MSTPTLAQRVAWAGVERLVVEPQPAPNPPGPDEILIRVESVGVCGTDTAIWRGKNDRIRIGTVPGHEFGGTVMEVGLNVTIRSVGQLVAVDPNLVCGECRECATGSRGLCRQRELMGLDVDGGLQSYVTVNAANTVAVPGAADPRALALIEPIAVGVHACARANISSGARLVIVGGGAIGMASALQALRLGADSVTVIEPDTVRRGTITDYGVIAIAPGEGIAERWDVAIDTVGSSASISAVMEHLEPGSTICVAGLAQGGTLPPTKDLVRRELTLTGTFCYTSEDLTTAAALVARHGLGAIPNDLVQGFNGAPAAIEAFAEGRLGRGKTLIIP
ncbi:alcohol dehydrogenase catalytic domain-containing protein [Arthrobacter sp. NPDC080073]|uniref:zinc-dependent alcohol dehydrogenase n=1 Tax=Arthrobacter sp. NPDC080073 TaxID=3155919 RepID=UPI003437A0F0